ncbi:M48 family metallopeptidase [Novosphingobium tardum]
MTLRLAPDGSEARVTLPPWGRVADAEAFARDRADWLAGQLVTIAPRSSVGCGTTLPFRGDEVVVRHYADAPRQPRLDDGEIVIGGPTEAVAARIQRWLERQALDLGATDLGEFAARAEVAVPSLRLSRAARRWGSCASDGTIRLNWRLIMAPDMVRRSVAAHEIAHLVHFDHSPAFYRLLDRIYDDDLTVANRWLKTQGRSLYAPFG